MSVNTAEYAEQVFAERRPDLNSRRPSGHELTDNLSKHVAAKPLSRTCIVGEVWVHALRTQALQTYKRPFAATLHICDNGRLDS